jgi:hypothetical protein
MVYSREIESRKASLKLSDVQSEMLVGLILGDAHLETQSNGRTYRVKFEYGSTQREYANHLYESFREWVRTPPQVKLDATHNNVWFQTVSHSAFRFYAHQFYNEKRKCVPLLIHRFLTARGIAYWFMDDGSMKSRESKAVIFNTQGFAQKDVERLVECLRDTFSLEAVPRRQEEELQIYVSGKSFERFREIVHPYILPSMRYKIPADRIA